MKANLPAAAVQANFDAMSTHQTLATRLLSDERARRVFVDVVYEMLMRDQASGLFSTAISTARPPQGAPLRFRSSLP